MLENRRGVVVINEDGKVSRSQNVKCQRLWKVDQISFFLVIRGVKKLLFLLIWVVLNCGIRCEIFVFLRSKMKNQDYFYNYCILFIFGFIFSVFFLENLSFSIIVNVREEWWYLFYSRRIVVVRLQRGFFFFLRFFGGLYEQRVEQGRILFLL